jgi:hypothetical protein
MPAISVQNEDWSVLTAVRSALEAATIDAASVFEAVTVTTSDVQAVQCQFSASPIVVLRYVTTREDHCPEEVRGCCVELELTIAVQVNAAGTDESSRLEEVLRLKNAAVNAVGAAPPANAHAWGDANHYHTRVQWGRVEVDTKAHQPWAICKLPVAIGFVLDSPTSH